MKRQLKGRGSTTLALLLSLPAALFIGSSALKYSLSLPFLHDAVAPFFAWGGIKEGLGWNINALILFGPLLSLGLAGMQVVQVESHRDEEALEFRFFLLRKWYPLLVSSGSALLLIVALLFHMV